MGAVSLAICRAAKEAGVHIETDKEVCFLRPLSFLLVVARFLASPIITLVSDFVFLHKNVFNGFSFIR